MLEFLHPISKKNSNNGLGFAIFSAGDSNTSSASDKYWFASDILAAGSNLGAGMPFSGAGLGNHTRGLFAGGRTSTSTGFDSAAVKKYTYSTNAVSNGTSLTKARFCPGGCGNSAMGIVSGGQSGNVAQTTTDRYGYSNDGIVPSTALGLARVYIAAAGNEEFGIFAGGFSTTQRTDRYIYNSAVFSQGTNLIAARYGSAATSTPTHAYFFGGHPAGAQVDITEAYSLSQHLVSKTTALGLGGSYMAGTGNPNVGLVCYNVGSIKKYLYTTNAVSSGTSLSHPRYWPGALSSNPGGF